MQHTTDYLVVGAGMAGEAAAHAIREHDAAGRIDLLGAEADPPYDRPPLSKALWKPDADPASVFRPVGKTGAQLSLGRHAVKLDPAAHRVEDDRGDTWQYRKLLIATGGTPRTLAFGGDRILHYRTLADYRRLRELAQPGAHLVVVGGGFIGSEIAAALATNGCKVTMVFPEAGIGARAYPEDLVAFVTGYYRQHGVDVRSGLTVSAGAQAGNEVRLTLSDGTAITAGAVVAGLGITPNTKLAQDAGLAVDNGIVVDANMATSAPDVYAAGDVASFPNPDLGRMRVEHENAAISMGHRAGLAMTGHPSPYTELPFFYSDLFDLGYEAVGRLDARLDLVEDWKTPGREGVVYYLDDGRVRGVLLWNTWGQVDAARALIAEPGRFDDERLRGRLPATA